VTTRSEGIVTVARAEILPGLQRSTCHIGLRPCHSRPRCQIRQDARGPLFKDPPKRGTSLAAGSWSINPRQRGGGECRGCSLHRPAPVERPGIAEPCSDPWRYGRRRPTTQSPPGGNTPSALIGRPCPRKPLAQPAAITTRAARAIKPLVRERPGVPLAPGHASRPGSRSADARRRGSGHRLSWLAAGTETSQAREGLTFPSSWTAQAFSVVRQMSPGGPVGSEGGDALD
jgi:hypothetical protein